MIKEFDYRRYLARDLPISQEAYRSNVKEFFGKTMDEFNNFHLHILNGRDISVYVSEKVEGYLKERKNLALDDMKSLYSDEVYLARNICHEFTLQLPQIDQLFNQYEFIVPLCLLKDKAEDRRLFALDHGSAMGWQGILMWCFGYHVTFCDLSTKYFEFLKFQCRKANMIDIDFIDVTAETLDLSDRKFDFINSFFVFEHILHVEEDLREIASHLNEGGYFNLRVDFNHGGLCIKRNQELFGDSIKHKSDRWRALLKENCLEETDFFEDHIYQKITKGGAL